MNQTTQRRTEHIISQIYSSGRVSVRDLAEELSVSPATIRRDLRGLADGRKIRLVHGGATLGRLHDDSFRTKAVRNVEAKQTIGHLAAELVTDNDQVFIDSGTTAFQLALCLRGRRGLSIIANSARLALELDAPGLNVILIGGKYRPGRMDTVGPMAAGSLEQLRGYVAFVGADGLSREFGLAADDIDSAHLNGLAIRHARRAVLLVDHSKFTAPSLFKIARFEAICQVVTDRRPEADWMDYFASLGVDVTYPSEEPAAADRTAAGPPTAHRR
jgi:DeoR/GlpR family transcriptional regulator of sugar metabolism